MQVDIGPVMAAVKVGGIQVRGFFIMLGICSIDVPIPCDTSPPQRFSLNDITANPTIWAQHPTVAAPAARPSIPSMTHMATELIGRVKAQPTRTDTAIPIMNGLSNVALFMTSPR